MNTLMAGIRSRSTECVFQNPTPAVRRIASLVVNSFKTLSMSAVAKSDGGIATEEKKRGYYSAGQHRCGNGPTRCPAYRDDL